MTTPRLEVWAEPTETEPEPVIFRLFASTDNGCVSLYRVNRVGEREGGPIIYVHADMSGQVSIERSTHVTDPRFATDDRGRVKLFGEEKP